MSGQALKAAAGATESAANEGRLSSSTRGLLLHVVKTQLLREVPRYEKLSELELHSVSQLFWLETLDANVVVFREGDVSASFYILLRGRARVMKKVPNSERLMRQVATVSAEDTFPYLGDIKLHEAANRNSTVVTMTNCLLLGLPQRHYAEFIRHMPFFESSPLFRSDKGDSRLAPYEQHKDMRDFMQHLAFSRDTPLPGLDAQRLMRCFGSMPIVHVKTEADGKQRSNRWGHASNANAAELRGDCSAQTIDSDGNLGAAVGSHTFGVAQRAAKALKSEGERSRSEGWAMQEEAAEALRKEREKSLPCGVPNLGMGGGAPSISFKLPPKSSPRAAPPYTSTLLMSASSYPAGKKVTPQVKEESKPEAWSRLYHRRQSHHPIDVTKEGLELRSV